MALPKIEYPVFTLEIPSTKAVWEFRPFLVKEEKILLMAQQTGEAVEVVQALRQVINNCTVGEIAVDKLTMFDIEYMFLQLRSKSVNNIVDVKVTDKEDGEVRSFQIDLDEIKVKFPDVDHSEFKANDIEFKLRYPPVSVAIRALKIEDSVDQLFFVVQNCIEKLTMPDGTVHKMSDYTADEITTFTSDLGASAMNKIREFLAVIPSLKHEIKYTNSKGTEQTIALTSITDFFTLG